MFLVAWVITCPEAAMNLIAGMRRQIRQSLIQRYGNQALQDLAAQLKDEARRMSIPEAIAEEVIEVHKQEIVERLGSGYARELLDD